MILLFFFSPEFSGQDRPRQLALNGSTTDYHLKNVAHNTEYVLTLYVLFGSVLGPGVTATFRTCEYCKYLFHFHLPVLHKDDCVSGTVSFIHSPFSSRTSQTDVLYKKSH